MLDYHKIVSRLDSGDVLSSIEVDELLASNDGYLCWAGLKACGIQKIGARAADIGNCVSRTHTGLDDEDLTAIAAWALSQMPDVASKFVIDNSSSQHENVRLLVADLLGLIQNPSGIPLLQKLLQDPSAKVSKWAALSLSKKGAAAVQILDSALHSTQSDSLIAFSLDALRKIGSKDAKRIAIDYVSRPGHEKFAVFTK